MKLRIFLSFVLIVQSLMGNDSSFYLTVESLSPEEIRSKPYGDQILKTDPGHKKWFILCHNMPEGEAAYTVRVKRAILASGEEYKIVSSFSKKTLSTSVTQILYGVPGLIWTSKGHLPGEKIEVLVESSDGKTTATVEFIPNPLTCASELDKAFVEAEMVHLNSYLLTLTNFKENEKIHYTSKSKDEVISHVLEAKTNNLILSQPNVLGETGGVATLTFARDNGEELKLHLPWKDSLIPYFMGKVPIKEWEIEKDKVDLNSRAGFKPNNFRRPPKARGLLGKPYSL